MLCGLRGMRYAVLISNGKKLHGNAYKNKLRIADKFSLQKSNKYIDKVDLNEDKYANSGIKHNIDLFNAFAACGRNDLITSFLTNASEFVNYFDEHGRTALDYASFHGHTETIDVLKEYGAKFIDEEDYPAITPLHCAAAGGHKDACRKLLKIYDLKEKVNFTDEDGITPLHVASGMGYKSIVEFLVTNGANSKLKDIDGFSPIDYAQANNHLDILDFLIFGVSE